MTEIVYVIIHAPSGKHHLKKGEHTVGFFPTHAEALDGMKRDIAPVISTFDKNGDPT